MRKLIVGLMVVVSASALVGEPYTNEWINTEGVNVVKNWNDAANWSVAYGDGTPEPASSVPTAQSWTRILRSASITLQNGDDLHLGRTWLLASQKNLTLNLTIPTGAKLSLDGADTFTVLGTPLYVMDPPAIWVDGPINNKLTLDIDGGSLTFGQKIFGLRGSHSNNTASDPATAPVNVINVRNGGTFAVTNGAIWFAGGEIGSATGKGNYTNVINVLKNGTLAVSGPGYISMGGPYTGPSTAYNCAQYCGGGWINVRGGLLDFTGCTRTYALQMSTHENSPIGCNLIVEDGGVVNLGGRDINLRVNNRALIRVADGGVLTNGTIAVTAGKSTSASYDVCIEQDGGEIFLDKLGFGQDSTENTGRATLRTHGPKGHFRVDHPQNVIYYYYMPKSIVPYFVDLRLAAHTPRTADFPVVPITFMTANDVNMDGRQYHGYNRLSPDGGLQLVHARTFALQGVYAASPTMAYGPSASYGGIIGEEMWQTNSALHCADRWTRHIGYEWAFAFSVSLKDEAKLTDGATLATPVPRAWLPLPKFTARQLDTNRTERISVHLDLAPQGDATLDSLIAEMKANGHETACADDSVDGYNVRVDLPMDELAVDAANDSIVMDFVKVDTYAQACGTLPFQTNALIRAASCEVKKVDRGIVLIVR